MTVQGTYLATSSSSNSNQIYSGGSLNIISPGLVRLGNQSSGFGYTDLVVNSNGILNVLGGSLEIDDQLNIKAGGTFNMTSGYVFAHKYGDGSLFNSSYPGSLNVAAGASGSVTGGVVRVCGKTNGTTYSAISLNDPDFDFSGTSTLLITNGISSTRSDVSVYTVNGADLQNLSINKPGYNVKLSSDMVINGQIIVADEASVEVLSGYTVTINGGSVK